MSKSQFDVSLFCHHRNPVYSLLKVQSSFNWLWTDMRLDNLLYFLHYLVLKQYTLIMNIISPKLVMPTWGVYIGTVKGLFMEGWIRRVDDPPQGNVGYMGQPAYQLNILTRNKKKDRSSGGKEKKEHNGVGWEGGGGLPDVGNRALGEKTNTGREWYIAGAGGSRWERRGLYGWTLAAMTLLYPPSAPQRMK